MARTRHDFPRSLGPPAGARPRAALIAVVTAVALCFTATSPAATDVSVSIVDRAYDPTPLTVNVGETVTWTNQSLMSHTVTAVGGTFGSGILSPRESFSVTFSTPGEYLYTCTIHPSMKGTVIVRGAGAPGAPSPGAGSPAANGSPASVRVHLSTHHGAHASQTLVHVQAPRPGARVLVERYQGAVWRRVGQGRLSPHGVATLSIGASARPLRVVVPGQAGQQTLVSQVLHPRA
jgi:plastocyanin